MNTTAGPARASTAIDIGCASKAAPIARAAAAIALRTWAGVSAIGSRVSSAIPSHVRLVASACGHTP